MADTKLALPIRNHCSGKHKCGTLVDATGAALMQGYVGTTMEQMDEIVRLVNRPETATSPADAALADGINEFLTRVQNYATEDAVREFPMTAIAHINGLIGIIRKQAAALRARPQAVAEAVAKDAAPSCFACIHCDKDDEDYPCRSCRMMSHWSSAALLSAADTEVKKDA